MNYTSGPTPVTVGPPGPQAIPGISFGVDVTAGSATSPDGGVNGSNSSEVRIRSVDDIAKDSM